MKGSPQYINIMFETPTSPYELTIVFQGGFTGKECSVLVEENAEWKHVMDFWPSDVNERQVFRFPPGVTGGQHFQILFKSSTDFFGRITIYDLDIL